MISETKCNGRDKEVAFHNVDEALKETSSLISSHKQKLYLDSLQQGETATIEYLET
jgi:hypothetical protein